MSASVTDEMMIIPGAKQIVVRKTIVLEHVDVDTQEIRAREFWCDGLRVGYQDNGKGAVMPMYELFNEFAEGKYVTKDAAIKTAQWAADDARARYSVLDWLRMKCLAISGGKL